MAAPASSVAGKKESRNETKVSFEFCELCKLSHDQGRRHKYFPAHLRAVSNTLSRFQKKISEVQFFILNPILLRPEHATHNRIWCVFCALDIDEIGGYFVCGNAIRHLAGEEHLRNLKRFFLKHGKGTHQVASFKVSEEDLLKWEKRCEALRNSTSSSIVVPMGPVLGPPKEMRIIEYAPQAAIPPQLLSMLIMDSLLWQWACMEMGIRITWVAWKVYPDT